MLEQLSYQNILRDGEWLNVFLQWGMEKEHRYRFIKSNAILSALSESETLMKNFQIKVRFTSLRKSELYLVQIQYIKLLHTPLVIVALTKLNNSSLYTWGLFLKRIFEVQLKLIIMIGSGYTLIIYHFA